MRNLIAFSVLLACSLPVSAAETENEKTAVHLVSSQCEGDPVSQKISKYAKEEINRYNSMYLEDDYLEALFIVRIVCLSSEETEGIESIYSYVLTFMNLKGWYDYYLGSSVNRCGSNHAKACAEDLVGQLYSEMSEVRRRFREGTFDPR